MTAIYTSDEGGILTRHYVEQSAKQYIAEHNLGPITGTDRLLGWPETKVEWHGNIGIGRNR